MDDYKNEKDVLFISLAIDSKKDLISFLNTNRFRYAVIPQQNNCMENDMAISMFPTHILIDKNGKIVKVVNSIRDLIPSLKNELERS